MAAPRSLRRLTEMALLLGLLAALIVPFILFEERVLTWVAWLRGSDLALAITGLAFVGLLVADVFAPVPSSLIGVALGGMFGAAGGVLLCWLGLMGGALLGYGAGRWLGPPLVRAAVGPADLRALERLVARHGLWALIVLRAVPVLAEASALIAGAARFRMVRFGLAMALSNLGIALVYAPLGAISTGPGSMGLALVGAIAVPALAWLVARPFTRGPRPPRSGHSSRHPENRL